MIVPGMIEPICRDRDDDVVLATALAGECAAVITGDEDLLVLKQLRAIRMLAPSGFWRWNRSTGRG